MAIVINTSAPENASINNEMLHVVYEATKANDPTTYTDYSYVCDVYVASVLKARLISRPDPTHKRGIFDVSRALQPEVSYGLNAASASVDYTVRLAYVLKFGEQYGGTLYTNLTVDSTRYAAESFAVRPFTTSVIMPASGLATNRPKESSFHESQAYNFIPVFFNTTGMVDMSSRFLNEAQSNIGDLVLDMNGYTANTIRQFNVGGQTIPATATHLAIYLTEALAESAYLIRMTLLCDGKYTPRTLAWLNPYGGYDSQSFGLVSKKSIEIQRKEFSKLNYQIDASGIVSYQANNVFYGGKKGFGSSAKIKMSMTSHLLSAAEYTWLAELFTSPDVYFYDTVSAKFIPVTIGRTNYDFNNYSNSRLTPLQFDVEFADEYNGQNL